MYVYAWGGSSLNESGVPGLTADVAIVADVVPKLTKVKADVGSAAWSDKSPVYSGGTAVDAPLATPLFVEGYVVMPIRLAVQNISSVTVGKGDGTGVEVPLRGGNSILLLVLDESGILAHAVAKRPVSIAADVGWTLASDAFYYVKANGTPVITGEFPTGIDTQRPPPPAAACARERAAVAAGSGAREGDVVIPRLVASGVLSAAARMGVSGCDVGYREPADADAPALAEPWRLYIFRKGNPLASSGPGPGPGSGPGAGAGAGAGTGGYVRLDRQRYYLFGRDRAVAHIALSHASISKQHAVVQFRAARRALGEEQDTEGTAVPWLLDLKSRNGTYLNQARIPPDRFVRIRTGDTLNFGASSRDWVLVQEQLEQSSRRAGRDA